MLGAPAIRTQLGSVDANLRHLYFGFFASSARYAKMTSSRLFSLIRSSPKMESLDGASRAGRPLGRERDAPTPTGGGTERRAVTTPDTAAEGASGCAARTSGVGVGRGITPARACQACVPGPLTRKAYDGRRTTIPPALGWEVVAGVDARRRGTAGTTVGAALGRRCCAPGGAASTTTGPPSSEGAAAEAETMGVGARAGGAEGWATRGSGAPGVADGTRGRGAGADTTGTG